MSFYIEQRWRPGLFLKKMLIKDDVFPAIEEIHHLPEDANIPIIELVVRNISVKDISEFAEKYIVLKFNKVESVDKLIPVVILKN